MKFKELKPGDFFGTVEDDGTWKGFAFVKLNGKRAMVADVNFRGADVVVQPDQVVTHLDVAFTQRKEGKR